MANASSALPKLPTDNFEIAAYTQDRFLERYGSNEGGKDALQIYKKAVIEVTKQKRKRINEALHDTPPQESEDHPTYLGLFHEKWADRAAPGSLEAWDSHVAYLANLYAFALQIESENNITSENLEQRRPDLAALLVDDVAVEKEMPTVELVNDILSQSALKAIKKTNMVDLDKKLSTTRYPFSLPFHLPFNQITLGLREAKTSLGTVIRQTSQQSVGFIGGAIGCKEARAALRAYVELSPEQQRILTETSDANNYLESNYGPSLFSKIGDGTTFEVKTEKFCQATALQRSELDQLLAKDVYAATHSSKIVDSSTQPKNGVEPHKYGAIYLNQGKAKGTPTIDRQGKLTGTQAAFARLNRFIRLQCWLALPYDQLDWLIAALARASNGGHQVETFNDGMLRGLGLFRHLQREYGLKTDEFAALIHEISPYACDHATSLLDCLFHATGGGTSMQIDDKPFEVDEAHSQIVQHLRAGLGVSEAIFAQLAAFIKSANGKLTCSLPAISALYRLVKIPRLFGLSVEDGLALLRLMDKGSDTYIKVLCNPTITQESTGENKDILDVILAFESAVHWLKAHKLSVAQIVSWCTTSIPLLVDKGTLLKRLYPLKQAIQPWLLSEASLAELTKPVDNLTFLSHFFDKNGVVTAITPLKYLIEFKNEEMCLLKEEDKEEKHLQEKRDLLKNREEKYQSLQDTGRKLDPILLRKGAISTKKMEIQENINTSEMTQSQRDDLTKLAEKEGEENKKLIDLGFFESNEETRSLYKLKFTSLSIEINELKKEIFYLNKIHNKLLEKLKNEGIEAKNDFFEKIPDSARKQLLQIISQAHAAQLNAMASILSQLYDLPLESLRAILQWLHFDWQKFASMMLDLEKDAPDKISDDCLRLVYALDCHVDVVKKFKLNATALETLMTKSEWTDHTDLTVQDVYRLSRYADFLSSNAKDEAKALDYLQHFNAVGQIHTEGSHTLLADVFSWEKSEVKTAVEKFDNQGDSPLDHLDWLMRLHALSRQTGLSVASLLKAAKLPEATEFSEWQAVGQAVMSAAARGVAAPAT